MIAEMPATKRKANKIAKESETAGNTINNFSIIVEKIEYEFRLTGLRSILTNGINVNKEKASANELMIPRKRQSSS